MGKNTGMFKYGIGNIMFNAFPMYVFGSGILSLFTFLDNLLASRSFAAAADAMVTYYIGKLTPFPLNEFLTADGFVEVAVNIGFAVIVGAVVASIYWRKNV